MVGRLKLTLLMAAAALVVAPVAIHAQDGMQGRMRVLVPYFDLECQGPATAFEWQLLFRR